MSLIRTSRFVIQADKFFSTTIHRTNNKLWKLILTLYEDESHLITKDFLFDTEHEAWCVQEQAADQYEEHHMMNELKKRKLNELPVLTEQEYRLLVEKEKDHVQDVLQQRWEQYQKHAMELREKKKEEKKYDERKTAVEKQLDDNYCKRRKVHHPMFPSSSALATKESSQSSFSFTPAQREEDEARSEYGDGMIERGVNDEEDEHHDSIPFSQLPTQLVESEGEEEEPPTSSSSLAKKKNRKRRYS
jgi:hypothetical protein